MRALFPQPARKLLIERGDSWGNLSLRPLCSLLDASIVGRFYQIVPDTFSLIRCCAHTLLYTNSFPASAAAPTTIPMARMV
jgi:hypothetical protein